MRVGGRARSIKLLYGLLSEYYWSNKKGMVFSINSTQKKKRADRLYVRYAGMSTNNWVSQRNGLVQL